MDFIFGLGMSLPNLTEQGRIVDILTRAQGIVRLRRDAEKKAAELIPALFLDMFGDPATNPKGWPLVRLGDALAEPPTLGTMAKPSSVEGRWLDLRVANIQGGQLTLRDKKWIDLPSEQIDRFALRSGDIVLARAIGSLDHLGKAVVVEPDSDWTFDSHLMRVRLDSSRLLPIVFKGFLESSGGREEFLKHTRRSAVQFNINGKELREIRISLPPLDLQNEYVGLVEAVSSIQSQQSAATAKAQATFDALLAQVFG
jgi:type I restriction enzyme S subunit